MGDPGGCIKTHRTTNLTLKTQSIHLPLLLHTHHLILEGGPEAKRVDNLRQSKLVQRIKLLVADFSNFFIVAIWFMATNVFFEVLERQSRYTLHPQQIKDFN